MNDNEISNIDWTALQTASNFTVMPYDISSMTPSQYTELELSKSQKSQLSMIQSSFPKGLIRYSQVGLIQPSCFE